MKPSPLPPTPGASLRRQPAGGVSLVSMIFGALVLAFGVGLAVLTLSGAVSGFSAISFYDIAVGGMFLAFSWQSAKYGYEVMTGRQSARGEYLG